MKEVESVRDSLKHEQPYEDLIPYDDLVRDNPTQGCRTDLETYKGPETFDGEPVPMFVSKMQMVDPA